MTSDVDALFDSLQELDSEERQELTRKILTQRLEEFHEAQQAFLERLEKEGLIVPLGKGGKTAQPSPGQEEWVEYCREHQNDPICQAGIPPAGEDRLSDFLEIRGEYLSNLEQEGLVEIEELPTPRFAIPVPPPYP